MSVHQLAAEIANWRSFLAVLGVFGFAPGAVLRLIVLAYPSSDPRRKELVAELYVVSRWKRPLWVAEQLETALAEGVLPRVKRALLTLADHMGELPVRIVISSKMRGARRAVAREPDAYPVPSELLKRQVSVGDLVRFGWRREDETVGAFPVEIIAVKGDRLIGRTPNHAIDGYWARIRLSRDDIVGDIRWGWRQLKDSG